MMERVEERVSNTLDKMGKGEMKGNQLSRGEEVRTAREIGLDRWGRGWRGVDHKDAWMDNIRK